MLCRFALCADDEADDGAQVVTDNITQNTNQHSGTDQTGPALRDGHAGSGGGAADVGVGSDDGILQRSLAQLGANEAEDHVHDDHDEAQDQEQGGLGDNGHDVGGNTDDKQEQVDQIGADFLSAVHLLNGLGEEGGDDDRNGGDPHILRTEELANEIHDSVGILGDQTGEQAGDENQYKKEMRKL